jgi:hypothetical protein
MTVDRDRTKAVHRDETSTIDRNRKTTVTGNDALSVAQARAKLVGGGESVGIGVAGVPDVIAQGRATEIATNDELKVFGNRVETVVGSLSRQADNVDESAQKNALYQAGTLLQMVQGDGVMNMQGNAIGIITTTGHIQIAAQPSGVISLGSPDHNNVQIWAANEVTVSCGKGGISINSKGEISIGSSTKITIGVGTSQIEITPDGVTIQGTSIHSNAVGTNYVRGTMVKIN